MKYQHSGIQTVCFFFGYNIVNKWISKSRRLFWNFCCSVCATDTRKFKFMKWNSSARCSVCLCVSVSWLVGLFVCLFVCLWNTSTVRLNININILFNYKTLSSFIIISHSVFVALLIAFYLDMKKWLCYHCAHWSVTSKVKTFRIHKNTIQLITYIVLLYPADNKRQKLLFISQSNPSAFLIIFSLSFTFSLSLSLPQIWISNSERGQQWMK